MLTVLESKNDVKEVLEEVLEQSGSLQCVVVLGLYKDESQLLKTSTASAHHKAFLLALFQAWMTKWFKLGDE